MENICNNCFKVKISYFNLHVKLCKLPYPVCKKRQYDCIKYISLQLFHDGTVIVITFLDVKRKNSFGLLISSI